MTPTCAGCARPVPTTGMACCQGCADPRITGHDQWCDDRATLAQREKEMT